MLRPGHSGALPAPRAADRFSRDSPAGVQDGREPGETEHSPNTQLLIGILLPSQVKRVYHMIPRNTRIAWGSRISSGTPAQLKLNPCQLVDSNGKCRKLGVGRRNSYSRNRRNFYVKKFKPSRYLSWLKTYRRKN